MPRVRRQVKARQVKARHSGVKRVRQVRRLPPAPDPVPDSPERVAVAYDGDLLLFHGCGDRRQPDQPAESHLFTAPEVA